MEEEEHSSGLGFWFPADFLSETELLPSHWILSNSEWREKTTYIGPWNMVKKCQKKQKQNIPFLGTSKIGDWIWKYEQIHHGF